MDIKTMFFALALGNLCLCAALFFFDYGNKKSLTLSTWMLAKQLQAAGWIVLCMRGAGLVSDAVAMPLGYPLVFAGVAFESGAQWEAAERPQWRRLTWMALGLSIAVYLFCYLVDDVGLRTMGGAMILSGFYVSGVIAMALAWRTASMLRRALVVAMGVLCVFVLQRGILALVAPEGMGWLSIGMIQGVSSSALYCLMMLNGFGVLLLAREALQAELARLAVVDALTDVPNRRGFFNHLAPWLALARRPGVPTALVVLDLDHFKRINDTYGHPVGDTVLRQIVDVCNLQLRDSDQLGRMGGVEFALLLPRTNLVDASLVAERVRAAIEATPVKSERAVIKLTASFGVTTIRPDDSTVSLFKRADQALQMAKMAGRNKVVEAAIPDM